MTKLLLYSVFCSQSPHLFDEDEEQFFCDVIMVLREIWRVSRGLDADKRISSVHAPRLLFELRHTLLLHISDRPKRRRLKTANVEEAYELSLAGF